MKGFFFVLLISFSFNSFSQTGGNTTFSFLNTTPSARIASLGGTFIAVRDSDLNLAFQNPSLLNPQMSNQITFSGMTYFSDIKLGYVSYARSFNKIGTLAASIHHINYGSFEETDITGMITGQFKAAEYSFNLSYAKQLDSMFTIGGAVKTIYSALYDYSSTALAADIGASFDYPEWNLSAGIVAKNIGQQLKPFRPDNFEKLPFELQLGISKGLEKAPLRFSLNMRHLQKFDLTYVDPDNAVSIDPLTQEEIEEKISFGKKLLHHMVFSTELLLSKNFHVRAGYNFLRRTELGVDSRMATVGLNWGFGFRISKFHLSYGRSAYHLAGGSNHVTLGFNFTDFYRKKPTPAEGM